MILIFTVGGSYWREHRTARDAFMRTFLVACLAAAVIAICAVVVLNEFQKPVETAFATSAVRI
jgi:hypothetical protein